VESGLTSSPFCGKGTPFPSSNCAPYPFLSRMCVCDRPSSSGTNYPPSTRCSLAARAIFFGFARTRPVFLLQVILSPGLTAKAFFFSPFGQVRKIPLFVHPYTNRIFPASRHSFRFRTAVLQAQPHTFPSGPGDLGVPSWGVLVSS